MLIFTLRRFSLFIFTMLVLTLLSFSLSFLFPGDAVVNLSGQINATASELAQLNKNFKTDENIVWQYTAYLKHIINGDLGMSMASQSAINTEVLKLLPATIELSLVALLLAMFVGIPLGFIAAIMGIGGAFILVPAMIYIIKMPTRLVPGTSLFVTIFVSVIVTFLHSFNYGSIDLMLVVMLVVGSIIGVQVGQKLGEKIDSSGLKALLAILLLID